MFAGNLEADTQKPGLRQFVSAFGKLPIKPPVIACFVLALTIQYWMPAAVYVLLRTYLFAPSGIFAWSAACLAGCAFVIGMGLFFGQIERLFPLSIAAGKYKRAGDLEGHKLKLAAYRAQAKRIKLWPMFIAMLSMFLFISAIVTIILSDGTAMLKREQGKLRYGSREERLRATLRSFERRGLFAPLDMD